MSTTLKDIFNQEMHDYFQAALEYTQTLPHIVRYNMRPPDKGPVETSVVFRIYILYNDFTIYVLLLRMVTRLLSDSDSCPRTSTSF